MTTTTTLRGGRASDRICLDDVLHDRDGPDETDDDVVDLAPRERIAAHPPRSQVLASRRARAGRARERPRRLGGCASALRAHRGDDRRGRRDGRARGVDAARRGEIKLGAVHGDGRGGGESARRRRETSRRARAEPDRGRREPRERTDSESARAGAHLERRLERVSRRTGGAHARDRGRGSTRRRRAQGQESAVTGACPIVY